MRKGQSERENTFYCYLSTQVEAKVFFSQKERERKIYIYVGEVVWREGRGRKNSPAGITKQL